MTKSRTAILPRRMQGLKNAFRDLVEGFGGQDAVAAHWSEKTGRPVRQQWISDLCHRNIDIFPPIDLVAELESQLQGHDGHPHVTRALASIQDFALVEVDAARGETDLSHHLTEIAGETGDVLRSLTDLLDGKPNALVDDERGAAMHEARQLMEAASALLARLGGDNVHGVRAVPINRGEKDRGSNTN